jgi:EmrB/QacA subfamily drug resistance transporter
MTHEHKKVDDSVRDRAKTGGPAGPRAETWVLTASILGSSMAFIDGTVVNVALPTLQASLGATAAEVQWVVESYALTLAALLLLGGALGDMLGRRKVFSMGVGMFAGASAACVIAPDIRWLIVARGIQGVGGALLIPGSLALISACIPAERRGQAIGKWSAFSAAAAGIGPVLGGWLIQAVSWRAIFWLNLPLAAATLLITLRHVPESRDPRAVRLDLPGAALATLGLGGLVFGLLEAPRLGFGHPAIGLALAGGVLVLTAFIVVEARSQTPMVPLKLFRSRTFTGANLLTFLLYAALGGAIYFLPFNLIQVQGYSPTAAGAALLPLIVLLSTLSGRAGRLVDRYGARRPLLVGPLIAALGFALLAVLGGGDYWRTFFPGITVLGFGMAVTVAPLTTAVMGAVGPERAGVASGINNAVSRTASLLSIAVFGLVAYERFSRSLMKRLDALGLPPEVRQVLAEERKKLAGASVPASLPEDLRRGVRAAIDSSFVDAFRVVMMLAAGLAVASSITAFLLIGREQARAGGSGASPPD